jgi:GGDEF domain-containing protein
VRSRRALEQRVAARTTELNAADARLRELSYRDALTGLANRRSLLEALEGHACNAAGERLTLVFVEVDHVKNYNDRYGHPAGGEALRCVADAMRDCAPPDTLVARYGGEEFVRVRRDSAVANRYLRGWQAPHVRTEPAGGRQRPRGRHARSRDEAVRNGAAASAGRKPARATKNKEKLDKDRKIKQ